MWQQLPPILLPSPIMALAHGPKGLWAGGIGGVAWRPADGVWEPRLSGLPLTAVAALTYAEGWLLAGGAEGVARSGDGGLTWQLGKAESATQVAAIVASPHFAKDGIALAATMGDGILRTTDAGRTWDLVNFGLEDFEVTALAWAKGDIILAGTASGLYRSPNGGRAWRAVGGEGLPVAGLAFLPDGSIIAALEEDGLLRATDGGIRWAAYGNLPEEVLVMALFATPAGSLLLGTMGHGLLRSTDAGETWRQVAQSTALSFTSAPAGQGRLYAGTDGGLLVSADEGVTWQAETMPPIHDLRRLLIVEGTPLIAGPYTGVIRYQPGTGWETSLEQPSPLTGLSLAPDGSLFAAGPTGLARSTDAGATWQSVRSGELEPIEQLTFAPEGRGYARGVSGRQLLYTRDGGANWELREAPFGVLRLLALQAAPDMLLALTYNLQQQTVQPWRSFDEGQTWMHGAQVKTAWPLVATYDTPLLFTIGNTLYLQQAPDNWLQLSIGPPGSAVRRIVGNDEVLLALNTAGIYHSQDQGHTWIKHDDDLPVEQMIDIALSERIVYLLLAGGQVWLRSL